MAIFMDKEIESSELTSRDTNETIGNQRVSKRLRKRPSYFTPGNKVEGSGDEDVTFRAVVTDNKGFKDFQDSVCFQGTPTWRLNHVLSRLTRELKVDPRVKYVWAIFNETTGKWERLTALAQIKNQDISKLRIYRPKKSQIPIKKPPPKPAPKDTPRPPTAQNSNAQQTPSSSQMSMQSFPFVTPQEMMMANYMMTMMLYSNPWMFMPPFQ